MNLSSCLGFDFGEYSLYSEQKTQKVSGLQSSLDRLLSAPLMPPTPSSPAAERRTFVEHKAAVVSLNLLWFVDNVAQKSRQTSCDVTI